MSPQAAAVLAIDGGNSKTDLALVAADGTVLASVRGPGMPGRLSDETVRVIAGLLRSAVEAAQITKADQQCPLGDGQRAAGTGDGWLRHDAGLGHIATHTVACVANVDLPEEERQLTRMLAEQGWSESTLVANDTFAVLRAGLDDVPAQGAQRHWGVGVTCGTGINCAGMAPDGRTTGFLAIGNITGDWGGGFGIGLEAHRQAMRAEDGRAQQSMLRQLVPAHFGLAQPSDVAIALHLGKIGLDRIGELAPLVFQAADSGDEVARELVLRQADEVYLMARTVIRRLDLAARAVPVVLGGSVLAAGNPLLIGEITTRIKREAPAASVRVIEAAPVAGAALLGLDLIGAPIGALQRLRNSFAHQPALAAAAVVDRGK